MADLNRSVEIDITVKGDGALKTANKETQNLAKSADKAASGFAGIGANIAKFAAGIAGFGAVTQFLKSSLDASLQLQKSLIGLQSIAKRTGNNFDEISENVKKLASDGQASIGGLSKAYGLLLQQGIKADQAFSFLEAGKKLAAFQGITGNVEEDINSFIKALSTGSQELAENLSPSLNGAIKSLGGMAAISTDAAKKQQLLNLVIKEGTALTDDYNKLLGGAAGAQANLATAFTELKQSVGETLAPLFASIARGLTSLLKVFKEIPPVAKSAASAVALVGSALIALGPIFAVSGPVGVAIAGLAALAAGLATLRSEWRQDKTIADDLRESLGKLQIAREENDIAKQNQELEKQRKILEQIPEAYRRGLTQSDLLNASLERRFELVKQLDEAEKRRASDKRVSDEQIKKEILQLKIAQKAPLGAGGVIFDAERLAELESELKRRTSGAGGAGASAVGGGGGALKSSDFLLNDLQRTLAANQKAQEEFNESIQGVNNVFAQAEADAKRYALDLEAVRQASESVSSFYRTEFQNSIAGVGEAAIQAQQTLNQLFDAQKIDAEEFAQRSEEIEEAKQRRLLQIQLDYAERAAQSLAQVNAQAIALIQSQSTSGTLGAVGGLASAGGSALKEGGVLGGLGLAGLAGGLAIGGIGLGIGAAIFGAIEDAEEEAKRREEERQRRLEQAREEAFQRELKRNQIQLELLNLQLGIEKRLAQLAKERRDIELRIFELDAKTQSDILKRKQKEAEQAAAGLLGVQQNKPQKGIGRSGSTIGQQFTSNVAGATQAELQVLATGSEADKAKVVAAIQDRNNRANDVRSRLQTLVKAGDKADPNSFNDAIKFYQANKALLTPAERAQFESAFGAQIAFLGRKAQFDAGDANLQAGFVGAQLAAINTGQDVPTLAEFLGAPTRIGTGLAGVGTTLEGAKQETIAQNELLTDAREEIITAAEFANQLQTQQFRDRLEKINRAAETADVTGQAFDKIGELQKLAQGIGNSLGIADLANIPTNFGAGLTLTEKENYDLLLELLGQIKDSTAETAANTAPQAIDQRTKSFLDISRGGFVFGNDFQRLGIEGMGLDLPPGAQSLLLSQSAPGAQGNPQLATLIDIGYRQIDLLAVIAAGVDSDSSTNPQVGRQFILNTLADLQSRRIL